MIIKGLKKNKLNNEVVFLKKFSQYRTYFIINKKFKLKNYNCIRKRFMLTRFGKNLTVVVGQPTKTISKNQINVSENDNKFCGASSCDSYILEIKNKSLVDLNNDINQSLFIDNNVVVKPPIHKLSLHEFKEAFSNIVASSGSKADLNLLVESDWNFLYKSVFLEDNHPLIIHGAENAVLSFIYNSPIYDMHKVIDIFSLTSNSKIFPTYSIQSDIVTTFGNKGVLLEGSKRDLYVTNGRRMAVDTANKLYSKNRNIYTDDVTERQLGIDAYNLLKYKGGDTFLKEKHVFIFNDWTNF